MNLARSLALIASGRVDVSRLLTHSLAVTDARRAHEALNDPAALAITLRYGD